MCPGRALLCWKLLSASIPDLPHQERQRCRPRGPRQQLPRRPPGPPHQPGKRRLRAPPRAAAGRRHVLLLLPHRQFSRRRRRFFRRRCYWILIPVASAEGEGRGVGVRARAVLAAVEWLDGVVCRVVCCVCSASCGRASNASDFVRMVLKQRLLKGCELGFVPADVAASRGSMSGTAQVRSGCLTPNFLNTGDEEDLFWTFKNNFNHQRSLWNQHR